MAQWDVAKTQGVCAGCNQTLQPKQDYYAALIEETNDSKEDSQPKADGFARCDYCETCWEHVGPDVFCFWKTYLPEPQEKKKLLVNHAVLLDIFERLAGADEPAKINFRFVLALILMRKRILKYRQTDCRDGREVWIMGQVREQTTHEVINPRLDDAHIREVSEQLSTILRSEL